MLCGHSTMGQYENIAESKEDGNYGPQLPLSDIESLQMTNINADNENQSSHSIIQTVILQQQLLQKIQEDPNLCQCMKQLLNSMISQNPSDGKLGKSQTRLDNAKPTQPTFTQSCPECCKPIYSLATSLGLSNVFNTKSWSLDSAKVLELEKVCDMEM